MSRGLDMLFFFSFFEEAEQPVRWIILAFLCTVLLRTSNFIAWAGDRRRQN